MRRALQSFQQAIQLDPNLAAAYTLASQCYTWAKSFGWFTDPVAESAEGARLARRALDLGRDDAAILTMAGFGLVHDGVATACRTQLPVRAARLNSPES